MRSQALPERPVLAVEAVPATAYSRVLSSSRLALLLWAAWAVVLLGAYYVQPWRTLAAGPSALAVETGMLPALAKRGGVLAAAVLVMGAAAIPIGALLERVHGWPRLPPGWALARRLTFDALLLVLLLGALHAPVASAVQALAGARLPFAGEAASRALAGVFGALAVLMAALPAGGTICRWLGWRGGGWRDELLYHTAIGLGAVAYACGALAIAGLFRPLSIQVLLVVLVAWGLPRLWTMLWRAGHWPVGGGEPAVQPRWLGTGLLIVVGAATVMAGLTALAPETEYDALWYHLGLPRVWLEAGRPVDLVHEYVSLYPLTWELVFTAGLVTGGPIAAKLLHFVCLPLGALLTWQLSSRLVPHASPGLAVAFFVTVPMVLWEATTTYVDLALTVQLGLAMYALVRHADGDGRGWFMLAVVTLGLALAIKHLALVAAAILAPGLALWLWRQSGRSLAAALRAAILLVLLAALVPLPWYARNVATAGNPFFPDLYGLFGASPAERWDDVAEQGLRRFKERFGRPRTPAILLALPWDLTVHAARYGGSLGPLFLLLLPGLALVGSAASRVPWLISFIALYLAIWASPISSFQLRFLVPLTPLLAALAAEAVRRLSAVGSGRTRTALAAGLLGLFFLNLPPFTPLHERDRVGSGGWLTHVIHAVPLDVVLGRESQDEYLARHLPTYRAWRFINAAAPADARVLTFRGGDHFYTARWRISSVAPMARAAVWGAVEGEEDQALEALQALGITHVLIDRWSLETIPAGHVALVGERMRRAYLELSYEDDGALVYQVVGSRQSTATCRFGGQRVVSGNRDSAWAGESSAAGVSPRIGGL
jgi:hypothetical protein